MPLPFIVSLNMPPSLPQSSSVLPPLSLYIHVPWCVRKCPYCDFNSHATDGGEAIPEALYLNALLSDLATELATVSGRTLHSIFLVVARLA